jgi:hypothetical protein
VSLGCRRRTKSLRLLIKNYSISDDVMVKLRQRAELPVELRSPIRHLILPGKASPVRVRNSIFLPVRGTDHFFAQPLYITGPFRLFPSLKRSPDFLTHSSLPDSGSSPNKPAASPSVLRLQRVLWLKRLSGTRRPSRTAPVSRCIVSVRATPLHRPATVGSTLKMQINLSG